MEHTNEHDPQSPAASGAEAPAHPAPADGTGDAAGGPGAHPAREAAAGAAADVAARSMEITFHCLCLYVPDEETERMHVLMPSTAGHHPHVVKLLHAGKEFDMEGWATLLPGTGGVISTALPGEIPNLSAVAGSGVDPVLVDDTPGGAVVSRITLDAGGVTQVLSDVFWELNGSPANMPQHVVWTVPELPGGDLTWTRTRLARDGIPAETHPLVADDDGVIRMAVYHVLAADWPAAARGTRRQPADSAAHFMAFYGLLDVPAPAQGPIDRRLRPSFARRLRRSISQGCGGGRAALRPRRPLRPSPNASQPSPSNPSRPSPSEG